VVGKPVAEPPSVVVKDALGNPVSGVEVQFFGGDVTPSSVITSATGRAKATTWTLGATAGEQSVYARVPSASLAQVEFRATVAAGAPTKLIVTLGQARMLAVGVIAQLSVRFEDAFGNPVAGPAPLSFSSSNTNVATVSRTGAVGALGPGTANILATADTLTAGIPVVVPTHIAVPAGYSPTSVALVSDDEAITANGYFLSRVNLVSGAFGPSVSGVSGEIVVDAASGIAYVTRSRNVSVLQLSTNSVIESIAIPGLAVRMVAAPDAQKLYIGDDSGHVFRIDVTTKTTTTFTLQSPDPTSGPAVIYGLAVSSDGATLYASTRNGGVYRVRTADGQILRSSQVGPGATHVVLSLDGTELYEANEYGWIDALDAQSLQSKRRLTTPGTYPYNMALSPDGQTLFAISPQQLYVVSPATMTIRYTIPFLWSGYSQASQIVFRSDGTPIFPTQTGLEILPRQP